MDQKKRAVLLLSGGLDSSSLLFWSRERYLETVSVFVDYGQPTSISEWRAASSLTQSAGTSAPLAIRMEQLHRMIRSFSRHTEEVSTIEEYFPSRNLLLVSVATMVAHQLGIGHILIGIVAGTAEDFPDTSADYIEKASRLITVEHKEMMLVAPFLGLAKREIVSEAIKSGMPAQLTFSCNIRPNFHCWQCGSCSDRWSIFSELGIAH